MPSLCMFRSIVLVIPIKVPYHFPIEEKDVASMRSPCTQGGWSFAVPINVSDDCANRAIC